MGLDVSLLEQHPFCFRSHWMNNHDGDEPNQSCDRDKGSHQEISKRNEKTKPYKKRQVDRICRKIVEKLQKNIKNI
jgi:hypothetical protein